MFDGFIRDHAYLTPRAAAVVTPERTISYAEFNADIDRFSATIGDLGVTARTNVVSVALDNPYLTYVLIAALARLRVATSPFNDPGAEVRLTEARPGAGDDSPGPRLIVLHPEWIARVLATQPTPLPVLEIDPEAAPSDSTTAGSSPATWAGACPMAVSF